MLDLNRRKYSSIIYDIFNFFAQIPSTISSEGETRKCGGSDGREWNR
jgi:hypothetical protein